MTREPASRPSEAAGIRALWRTRPAHYSRALWVLMLGLDLLPWPWGEDILARLFMAVGAVRASRRRRAAAWARAHPGHRPWRLAAALCAFRGRWVARSWLLGLRCPDDVHRHLVVRGEEHLTATPGAAILLGFHLGPPNADLALRILGHRLTWLGGERISRGWRREAWRPFLDSSQHLASSWGEWFWPGLVYRARRILLDGGHVFLMADGAGREMFRVAMPGRPVLIKPGWLVLHRHTGARVLPVLTHLEGRTQVITIHPPLPMSGSDPASEAGAWRDTLTSLLQSYVRRFPEQCPALVFPFRSRSDVGEKQERLGRRASAPTGEDARTP